MTMMVDPSQPGQMSVIPIDPSQCDEVFIGRQWESYSKALRFDISHMVAELGPGGHLALHVQAEQILGETIIGLGHDGKYAWWPVTKQAATLHAGRGRLWLTYRCGDRCVRSASVRFYVTM